MTIFGSDAKIKEMASYLTLESISFIIQNRSLYTACNSVMKTMSCDSHLHELHKVSNRNSQYTSCTNTETL
jgi:hypothetical protein